MKILLVVNKTLQRGESVKLDSGYYNLYIPLLEMGHEIYFYDTINPIEKDFNKIVNVFKPELIFCCISGNKNVTPFEPLDQIKGITKKGNIKTFNWFCDDTWRFDNFSQHVCHYFTICSTPEYSFLNKFISAGYKNIILGQWHCNEDLYLNNFKKYNIGFCGGMNETRLKFLKQLNKKITYFHGCSYEDMISLYSSCKISLNLSINDNDSLKRPQMKLRIFETTCSNSLLLTENSENLQMYYEPNKEIICFESIEECSQLIDYYLNNENEALRISQNGRNRFLKEHTSKIRLANLLYEINKI
jgi:spore maturation protein CgeB